MDVDQSPFPPGEVRQLAGDAQLTGFLAAGAIALLLYDHLLTFKNEFEFFWASKQGWKLAKCLFFWNRYTPIVFLIANIYVFTTKGISNPRCHDWETIEGLAGFLAVITADFIMMLRVYILYQKNKKILRFLIAMFVLEVCGTVTLLALGLSSENPTTIDDDPRVRAVIGGCFPADLHETTKAWFFPPLAMATLLFLMTIYKNADLLSLQRREERIYSPVKAILMQHGAIYFLVIVVAMCANAITWYMSRAEVAQAGIGPAIAVSTVVGSRLLLQIKRIGRHPPVVTDGSRRISMSLTMTELCPIAFDIKSEVTTFATESTAVSTHGHPRVAERDIV